uniref:periplasmic nitrate reductase, NapE protein n=1 Tax=Thaumasiovibrio occultus TaxID=1891184 RepID=UPI000B354A03|nr:periplasmic nitrate reductase, NapE protein [Thaumasiovibrio occultus]
MSNNTGNQDATTESTAGSEWRMFLFIIILLGPILAVAIVGGYGFFIWMMQLFFWGPPGHG